MSVRTPDITGGVSKGSGNGFVVTRDPALNTNVIITSGVYEVSGKEYVLGADSIHSMISLAVGLDLHYIYLDVSLSSLSSPVFYDETTEPIFDPVRNGQYHPTNIEDRLVGALTSVAGAATVSYFDVVAMSGNRIRNYYPNYITDLLVASLIDPDGTWQTPNIAESSVFMPASAVRANVWMTNSDTGGTLRIGWLNNAAAVVFTAIIESPTTFTGFSLLGAPNWGALDSTRNIKIGGNADDDNFLLAAIAAYEYGR